MNKFNIYYAVESENYIFHVEEGLEFSNAKDALEEAKSFAYDLYMQDPHMDILEIMKEKDTSEDVARVYFNLDMFRKTLYYIEEIIEVNGEVKIITHQLNRGIFNG